MKKPVDQSVDGLIRYRVEVAYDGTKFQGWAKQPRHRTVAGELLRCLTVIFGKSKDDFHMRVAGRTDAGVHAIQQFFHIDLSPEQLKRMGRTNDLPLKLNSLLDPDIRVYSADVAPAGYDARFSATYRRYRYRIADGKAKKDPQKARYTLWINHELDLKAMQDAALEFIGLQDFLSFCRPREIGTTIRNLKQVKINRNPSENGVIEFELLADAFCHNMVRSVVGALKAVGEGKVGRADIREALASKRRAGKFKVLEPQGLTLIEIGYPADAKLGAQAEMTQRLRTEQDLEDDN